MKHPQMTEDPPRRSNRSPADTDAIAAAIVGLDRDARALETQWGVGRLLVLADDLLRAKFNRQARRLNELVASAASAQDVTVQPVAGSTRRSTDGRRPLRTPRTAGSSCALGPWSRTWYCGRISRSGSSRRWRGAGRTCSIWGAWIGRLLTWRRPHS